jgi:hypothetical protein
MNSSRAVLGPRTLVGCLGWESGHLSSCADDLENCQIAVSEIWQDSEPDLKSWRLALAHHRMLLVRLQSDEHPKVDDLYHHLWLDNAPETKRLRRGDLLWDSENQTLSTWDGKHWVVGCQGKSLANALVDWQTWHSVLKNPSPWKRRFWQSAILGCLAFTGLSLWPLSVLESRVERQISKPQVSVSKQAVGRVYARDGYELRRSFRAAAFQIGYAIPGDAWMVPFLDQFLRSKGWDEGFKPGVEIKYSPVVDFELRPDDLTLMELDDDSWNAMRYYANLIGDSLAYPTDFWWKGSPEQRRIHDGVDVAAPVGSRLFAPFDGRAWSWTSPNGGRIAGISSGNLFLLFAHCDQILFFNGDSVQRGDAVATVGMTGRTSGPHAHIGTGTMSPKSDRGTERPNFALTDPVSWYKEHRRVLDSSSRMVR